MELANQVARRMWNDPEGESVAGECLLNAIRSFDPGNGTPIQAYIMHCVKMGVLDAQRRKSRRREVLKDSMYWEEVYDFGGAAAAPANAERSSDVHRRYCTYSESAELLVSQEDWTLLVERYIDKIPIDVIARRRNTTVYRARKLLHGAAARFKKIE